MQRILEKYLPAFSPEGMGNSEASAPSGDSSSAPSDTSPQTSSAPSGENNSASADSLADGFDFSPLGAVEIPGESDPSPAPAEATPAQPAPVPVAPAVQTPQAQPQVQQQVAPAQASVAPSEPVSTEGMLAALQQNEAALVDALASERFALSDADKEALETDAITAVPKLLARTFVQAHSTTLQTMQQLVPQMVAQYLQSQSKGTEAVDSFYKAFPQIDRTMHHDEVMRLGKVLRGANPEMPRQEFIQQLGSMIVAMKGIQNQGQQVSQQQNGRVVGTSPAFIPAMGGGASSPSNLVEDDNPFGGLAQEYS